MQKQQQELLRQQQAQQEYLYQQHLQQQQVQYLAMQQQMQSQQQQAYFPAWGAQQASGPMYGMGAGDGTTTAQSMVQQQYSNNVRATPLVAYYVVLIASLVSAGVVMTDRSNCLCLFSFSFLGCIK